MTMQIALYVAFVFIVVFAAPIMIVAAIVWFLAVPPERQRRLKDWWRRRSSGPRGFEVKPNTGETPVPRKEMGDLPDRRLD